MNRITNLTNDLLAYLLHFFDDCSVIKLANCSRVLHTSVTNNRHFSYRWPWSFLKRQSRGTDDYNTYRLLRNTEVCMLNNICLVMNKVLTIRDVCHSMDVETVDKIKAICLLELFTHILFLNF